MLTFLLHVPLCLHASGSKVVLFLENRSVVIGELLCVRDSELVLATKIGCSDEELSRDSSLWFFVSTRDIREVKVKGRSRVLTGVAIGAGAGLAVGVAVALAQPREEGFLSSMINGQRAIGVIAGSIACGLFIGGALGEATSSGARIIVPGSEGDLTALRELARFPTEEPEFLRLAGH